MRSLLCFVLLAVVRAFVDYLGDANHDQVRMSELSLDNNAEGAQNIS